MKIAHLFFEITMSNGHRGLRKHLKKPLTENECAIFINRRWTALKMLTPTNVLLHLKQPGHRPINPEAIKYLPHCVSGKDLNYDLALKAAITKRFKADYPRGIRNAKV